MVIWVCGVEILNESLLFRYRFLPHLVFFLFYYLSVFEFVVAIYLSHLMRYIICLVRDLTSILSSTLFVTRLFITLDLLV